MTAWEYGYLYSIQTRAPRRPGDVSSHRTPEYGPKIFITNQASGPRLVEGRNDSALEAFNAVGGDGWLVDVANGVRIKPGGAVADLALTVDGVAEILGDLCIMYYMRREVLPT